MLVDSDEESGSTFSEPGSRKKEKEPSVSSISETGEETRNEKCIFIFNSN